MFIRLGFREESEIQEGKKEIRERLTTPQRLRHEGRS